MNAKSLMLLAGVLVVLLGVGLIPKMLRESPERKANVRADVPPPADVVAAEVAEIELSDATEKVLLRKTEKGWVFPAKFDAPVNQQRAEELAGVFSDVSKADRVADSTRMDAQFGLDPVKAKRIRYLGPNAKVLGDFVVGSVDQAGDRSFNDAGNYVRVVGRDTVWSHAKKLQHLAYPKASYWLDNRLFPTIEPKDVAGLIGKMKTMTLEFDDVPALVPGAESQPESRPETPYDRIRIAFTSYDEEVPADPTPPGPKSDAAAAESKPATRKERRYKAADPYANAPLHAPLVENIARLMLFSRFDDVAGTDPSLAQYGLDRPSASVELVFEDGTVRTLRLGNRAPPSEDPTRKGLVSRYAAVSGDSKVFLLSDYTASQLRKKPADLKPPEAAKMSSPDGPKPIELPDDAETRPVR